MLKVTPNRKLRQSLSLRVRIAMKKIRVRDMVKEVTLKAGGSNDTWIVNQVRLKAQL
jgi:hypothetical protein